MKKYSLILVLVVLIGACTSNRSKKNDNLLSGFEDKSSEEQAIVAEETTAASSPSEVLESSAPEQSTEANKDLVSEITSASPEVAPASELSSTLTEQAPPSDPLAVVEPPTSGEAATQMMSEPGSTNAPSYTEPLASESAMSAPLAEAKPAKKKMKARKVHREPTAEKKVEKAKELSEVPKETIWKKGEVLNRYYALRPGQTPETVSEVLFGTKDRAEELKKWNQGEWQVGRVLLYVSPVAPEDTDMKSFEVDQPELAEKANAPEAVVAETAPSVPPPVADATMEDKAKKKKLANAEMGDFVGRYLTFIVAGLFTIIGLYFVLRKFFGARTYND